MDNSRLPTIEEYAVSGGDFHSEVVDGKIIVCRPHVVGQADIQHRLFWSLDNITRKSNLGAAWMNATFILDANRQTGEVWSARIPDVVFIKQEKADLYNRTFPNDDFWWLAPDIAAEVISSVDKYSDVIKKIADYLKYGVQLVWIIDPQTETVRVHTPDNPDGRTLSKDDVLAGESILPGWSIPVAGLFNSPYAVRPDRNKV